MVRLKCKEGHLKRIYNTSKRLSVNCKVQNGESFKSNLYAWAGRSVWPERRRLKCIMIDLDRWRLLNQVIRGIEGTKCLHLAAKSAGRFVHWEAQRSFMWWLMIGVKSVWGSWIREGHIKLDVDLARLSATSLPSIPMWLGKLDGVIWLVKYEGNLYNAKHKGEKMVVKGVGFESK